MVLALTDNACMCDVLKAAQAAPTNSWANTRPMWVGSDAWTKTSDCGVATTPGSHQELRDLKKLITGAMGTAPDTGQGLTSQLFWQDVERVVAAPQTRPQLVFDNLAPSVLTAYEAWKTTPAALAKDWQTATARDGVVFLAKALHNMVDDRQRFDKGQVVRGRAVVWVSPCIDVDGGWAGDRLLEAHSNQRHVR